MHPRDLGRQHGVEVGLISGSKYMETLSGCLFLSRILYRFRLSPFEAYGRIYWRAEAPMEGHHMDNHLLSLQISSHDALLTSLTFRERLA